MQACVTIAAEGRAGLLRRAMLAIAGRFPPAMTRKPAPDPVSAWPTALPDSIVALRACCPRACLQTFNGLPLRRCGNDSDLQSAIAIAAKAAARPSRRSMSPDASANFDLATSETQVARLLSPVGLAASIRHRLESASKTKRRAGRGTQR